MAVIGEKALFGRYWSADSPLHRLDPRTKVVSTLALVVILFVASTFASQAVVAAFVIALCLVGRIPLLQALRSIAPLLFIVVLTVLFNLFFVQGGDVLLDWSWLIVSQEGVRMAVFVGIRLLLLFLTGSLLTLTTTTIDITEAFESLLGPLAHVGFPAHEFAMILGIALRFLPQFAEELQLIRTAQLARGAQLATSPTRTGMASLSSLLVPLFTSVFRHADTLSLAMDARCYHGGVGRTRLHPLSFARRDAIAAVVLVVLLAAVIVVNMVS